MLRGVCVPRCEQRAYYVQIQAQPNALSRCTKPFSSLHIDGSRSPRNQWTTGPCALSHSLYCSNDKHHTSWYCSAFQLQLFLSLALRLQLEPRALQVPPSIMILYFFLSYLGTSPFSLACVLRKHRLEVSWPPKTLFSYYPRGWPSRRCSHLLI